jgi:hypothetical protein
MPPADRRSSARRPYYCEAHLEGLDVGRVPCRMADISVGGAFVEARTQLPAGARTRIRFHLAGREFVADAEVRYTSPGIGMGLHFIGGLSADDQCLILSFVMGQAAARARIA